MTISDVRVVSVPVADQDRARDFYVNTLGFELLADVTDPQQRWVQVGPKGSATSLTLVTWFPTMPAGSLNGLVIGTDDVDAEAERLREAGVAVDGPHDAPWGRHATLTDPDGNGLVLVT